MGMKNKLAYTANLPEKDEKKKKKKKKPLVLTLGSTI
jgi:hypothetical protein